MSSEAHAPSSRAGKPGPWHGTSAIVTHHEGMVFLEMPLSNSVIRFRMTPREADDIASLLAESAISAAKPCDPSGDQNK